MLKGFFVANDMFIVETFRRNVSTTTKMFLQIKPLLKKNARNGSNAKFDFHFVAFLKSNVDKLKPNLPQRHKEHKVFLCDLCAFVV